MGQLLVKSLLIAFAVLTASCGKKSGGGGGSSATDEVDNEKETETEAENPSSTENPGRLALNLNNAMALALVEPQAAFSLTGDETDTLKKVTPSGTLTSAFSEGSAPVKDILISPDGKVYLLFSKPVEFKEVAITFDGESEKEIKSCVLGVVSTNGYVSCVDESLSNISSNLPSAPIKFDEAGSIYYAGSKADGKFVLRRNSSGAATDLINDQIDLWDFKIITKDQIVVQGRTRSTNQNWFRRINAIGSIKTIVNDNVYFSFLLPNGKMIFGSPAPFGPDVKVFDAQNEIVESQSWIGHGGIYDTSNCQDDLCRAVSINGMPNDRLYRTTNDKVFAVGDLEKNIFQYYPVVAEVPTLVKKVNASIPVVNNLILAGLDASQVNRLTLLDTSNVQETDLLAGKGEIEVYHLAFNGGKNQLMFDGLRFSDNKYVVGFIDMATKAVVMTDSGVKLTAFQSL